MRTKVHFSPEQIIRSYTYDTYKALVADLVAQGRTTGPDQREDLVYYTELNARRMKRIEKTTTLSSDIIETLSQLNENLKWIVISEAWCGDAAQIVPVLAAIAEKSERIEMNIILRDEHLTIMDQYLTNGGRSIPKLICLDQHFQEVFSWGPRPNAIQQVVQEAKAEGIVDHAILVERIQNAYNQDKTQSIQFEINELLKIVI